MSLLKPGESLKIPSKAYDLIASKIKTKIENNTLKDNIEYIFTTLPKELDNEPENDENAEYEEKVLSKFAVTERYDPTNFENIKQSINRELVTRELNKEVYKRHYLDELNKFQKRKRNYKDFEQSIEKLTTHPKGKEGLEYRKLENLKQKVASNIPQPHEKKIRYIRSEIRKSGNVDQYSTDIWTFREIKKFINLFFENYKNFEEIQTKIPNKSVHELIALYDLLKPTLMLKKLYKKAKQKPSSIRKEYIKSILPKINEKVIYQLRKCIFANYATQLIIPLTEAKFSRADLIECFIYDECDQK